MKRAIFLLLGAIFSAFVSNGKAVGSSFDFEPLRSRQTSINLPFSSSSLLKKVDLLSIKRDLNVRGIETGETIISTYAVALASQHPRQDFFGFDPQSGSKLKEVTAVLDLQGYTSSTLLKDWIHQPNAAVKLAGFLNSFGKTLALADHQTVSATLARGESVDPMNLLDKAYYAMVRLISGQVVKINENRKATEKEKHILVQAAKNLGRKKAVELDILSTEPNFKEIMIDGFLADYNLLNPNSLSGEKLRHNLILLSISLSAGLGTDMGKKDQEIEGILSRRGFSSDILKEMDKARQHVYQNFPYIAPSEHIEDIVLGCFEIYQAPEPTPPLHELAEQALKSVEILGIDKCFIYEKLSPYGKPAFAALRNPKKFIGDIRLESAQYPFSHSQKSSFETMLNEIEKALTDPVNIHNINGFGYGSVAQQGTESSDVQMLTKRTWLSACHDFIVAYLYAKNHDCLQEFYADATPPENAPCLPGRIRNAQEWFESKTMMVDDTALILEKVFAQDLAGIELESAVKQLYRKYVYLNLEIYRAEKGEISSEKAKQEKDFKKEYLTLQAVKEGLSDMIKDNLPSVIRKYHLNRSVFFPINAFHSYKYNGVRLQDALGKHHGIQNTQEIVRRQAEANQPLIDEVVRIVEALSARHEIEIY